VTTPTSAIEAGSLSDNLYSEYLKRIQARFTSNTSGQALFTTDATSLYTAYIDALPEDEQAAHACYECRRFVDRFGGLVTIGKDGHAQSAIWNVDDAIDLYKASTMAMLEIIRNAKVTGVFLSSDIAWGKPVTDVWPHMSVKPAAKAIYKRGALTAGQAMAKKREDFKNVSAALKDFDTATLGQAIRLLKSDALYRSEKVLGAATWLRDLHNSLGSKHSTQRENKLWKAIAAAPAGFCHPRSSMIGTLLEDIAAGKNFEDVSRAFAAKMHPLQYQRPQAAPAAGTIEQAEKLVEKLGIQASLPRRFMRPDEVKAIWVPKKAQRGRKDGVFSHLKPKEASAQQSMELPAVKITWEKFQRTVLGDAERIEYYLQRRDEYCILVTSVNADAPPIIQWDIPEARNPASCYLWQGGSPTSQYGLPECG